MDRDEYETSAADVDAEEKEGKVKGVQLRYAIEIPLMLLMLGTTLTSAPMSNLIMYRSCVHALNHTVEECRSFLEPAMINHTKELEEKVQQYTTMVTTVSAVIGGFGPAVLALFVGVWADKHGRKPLLTVPMAGVTFGALLTMLYSFLEGFGPWWTIAIAVPVSFTGSITVVVIGMLCYINDITTTENRSMRLVFIQTAIALATTTGAMSSPYILQAIGTMYLFLIVLALKIIATTFTIFVIAESKPDVTPGTLLAVFDIANAKEMVITCFKKKRNYGRAITLICILTTSLSIFTIYGGQTLMYLYARNRIEWTMKDYTTYSAASSAMWFAGSLFGVGVIQRRTGISDLNFVAISFFSCVVEFILKTVATTTWEMYLASVIALFSTVSGPLIRSFLTKTLPVADIAKVFCFMGAADAFLPLLSPVLYNALYSATISVFPQSIMVMTSLIYALCFFLVLIVIYLSKKQTTAALQPYKNVATMGET